MYPASHKPVNKFKTSERFREIARWIEEDNPSRVQELRLSAKFDSEKAYEDFLNMMPFDDDNRGLIYDEVLSYLIIDNYYLSGKQYTLQSLYSEITGEVPPNKYQKKENVIRKI